MAVKITTVGRPKPFLLDQDVWITPGAALQPTNGGPVRLLSGRGYGAVQSCAPDHVVVIVNGGWYRVSYQALTPRRSDTPRTQRIPKSRRDEAKPIVAPRRRARFF